MSRLFCKMCFIAILAAASMQCTYAQETPQTDVPSSGSKIDSKVIERIRLSGAARVFVRLNVQIKTQEKLRPDEKQAQLVRIRAAQDAVLKELAGTHYKLNRKFDVVPTISMEIGPDALAVLERSSYVLKVYEIEKVYLDPGEIVPHRDK